MTVSRNKIPLLATAVVFLLLYLVASVHYRGFFTWQVFINLLRDNSFLGMAAFGMTFVILSGGIDLSVGARIGFTGILIAWLTQEHQIHPVFSILIALMVGTLLGYCMGVLIAVFERPAFLVTLAGMFLIRGLAFVISPQTIGITHPAFNAVEQWSYGIFPVTIVVLMAGLCIAVYLAHYTRFGRAAYAVGGSESSALLMGVAVRRTKIGVYALSGFTASVAGVLYTFYTFSGNANAGTMLELDAIAAVVIGGTLLSGGVGNVFGTFLGVLILGIIQTIITFQGTLSSWWTKIVIGGLLLVFILLQRFIQIRVGKS